MAGQLIAVANMKGGVGKTTTVVSLAEGLAAAYNASVLVLDLDPQSSASIAIAGDEYLAQLITEGRTVETFLEQRIIKRETLARLLPKVRPAGDVTYKGERLKISLLACGRHLRITEREILIELVEQKMGFLAVETKIFQELDREFRDLRHSFDYVLLDCAPGISPVTEAAIRASDFIVVPTVADFLSVMGLNAFCRSMWHDTMSVALPQPKKPYVLVTRWQQNVRQQREQLESLKAEADAPDGHFNLFKTHVPQSAALASALSKTGTRPTFKEKYGADVLPVLANLIKELKGAIACRSTSTGQPSSRPSSNHPQSSKASTGT
ncbi:MAG: ParA family protein [Rhodovulum sp.]|nr:ParA family protein [Rhodovulum sp.]